MLSKDFMQQVAGRKKRDRLAPIEILVADSDPRLARLVKQVLETFGFRVIHIAHDGEEAVSILLTQPVKLVISEWPMSPMSGMDLLQYIRKAPDSPKKDLPVIMLTGRAGQQDVEKARDSGVTEYLVKPFTAKTLSHRIAQVIDNPRSFILSNEYVGPDRRRQRALPSGVEKDRRRSAQQLQERAVRKGDGVVYNMGDEVIIIKQPDRALKELVGSDITVDKIFDPEVIREAQEIIRSMQDEYLQWVTVDIGRLEYCYNELERRPEDLNQTHILREVTFSVMSQAGTFGFPLASAVAKKFHEFLEMTDAVRLEQMPVLRKHIDTLYVIFNREINGEGEMIDEAVLISLDKLIEKFA